MLSVNCERVVKVLSLAEEVKLDVASVARLARNSRIANADTVPALLNLCDSLPIAINKLECVTIWPVDAKL